MSTRAWLGERVGGLGASVKMPRGGSKGKGGKGVGSEVGPARGDVSALVASPALSRKRELSAESVGENAWVVRGVLSPREATTSSADSRIPALFVCGSGPASGASLSAAPAFFRFF